MVRFAVLALCGGALAEEQHDARVGDNVTLACRFTAQSAAGAPLTYYWVRTAATHENVAIGDIPLQNNYQLHFFPQEGRYDLEISNASYERDNGQFECRVKAGGSGRTLHAQAHTLTVLTAPQEPSVSSGPHAAAQEGRELQLICSSAGGSPPPTIKNMQTVTSTRVSGVLKLPSNSLPATSSNARHPGRGTSKGLGNSSQDIGHVATGPCTRIARMEPSRSVRD
ncbi:Irregular chiasm C-roughest protein [Eumeta japonica]|uniref:Irregular chiasm C-roughest protein n=1 Tax=Eumeta variegata TaxID=151549 RepID=A0A4C1XNR3_EUMVA|nr:Irregular chiasm C-roughest protein [Eumeta japonica]